MKKVILITGASSGIGKATAIRLLNEGYIVYATARRMDKLKELAGKGARVLQLDVNDHDAVQHTVSAIVKEQGRIDVLFNNAGYGIIGAVEDVDITEAREQFETNVFGVAALTKAVLPVMRQQQSGRIINTSSMSGKVYAPLSSWYHASKHALEGWSDCLRLEVKPFGIDVVIIEPGMIATAFGDVSIPHMKELAAPGPYSSMYKSLIAAVEKSIQKAQASSPDVIAGVVSKAIKAEKPAIRYVAGNFAKPALFIRKWFGDKIYDKIVMSQLK